MMFRKYLTLALALLLFNAAGARSAFAGPGQIIWIADAAEVKAAVSKLGVGERARVWVWLRDNKRFNGYVKEARADDFVVVRSKDGTEVSVPYAEVKRFRGDNRSAGRKAVVAIIGIGATVTAIGLILWGASHY
ncbi:MAG TPA: hypothetical protein VF591_23255 [Pyrinomonadaceae bacterium]|jgi:hypothetical protein